MPIQKLNRELLLAAIDGFEFQKLRIDAQIVEIEHLLDGDNTTSTESEAPKAPKSGRKKFSAAARRRMAASQKARWAKIKSESASLAKSGTSKKVTSKKVTSKPATAKAGKPKRRLSAAGRAAIVAALKKRWAVAKSPAKGAKKKAAKAPARDVEAAA